MKKEEVKLTSANGVGIGSDNRTDAVSPDSALAWMAIVAAFACNVISDGIVFSFGIIQSEVVEFYDEPVAKVAWVFAIMNSVSLILAPVASAISNRYGFRVTVAAGGLLGFLGLASSSFATSVEVLMATTGILVGLSVCLVYTTVSACGSYYCHQRRALGTAIITCGNGAGSFLMPPMISWLIENFGLRGAYLILSALYLNCSMLALLLFPVTSHQPKERIRLFGCGSKRNESANSNGGESQSINVHVEKDEGTEDPKTSMRGISVDNCSSSAWKKLSETLKLSLFRSPTFIVFCISDFLASLGVLVPHIYLAAHAVDMGIDKTPAAFLLSIGGFINVIGKLVVGYVCDNPKVNLLIVNNVGYTIGGVLMLLLPFYTSYEWLIFYAVGSAIASCLSSVGGIVLLTRFLGLENANSAYGFILMFFGIGSLIGTPLAGWLYDEMGNYNAAFLFAGCSVLLSAVVSYPLGCINRLERRKHTAVLD